MALLVTHSELFLPISAAVPKLTAPKSLHTANAGLVFHVNAMTGKAVKDTLKEIDGHLTSLLHEDTVKHRALCYLFDAMKTKLESFNSSNVSVTVGAFSQMCMQMLENINLFFLFGNYFPSLVV